MASEPALVPLLVTAALLVALWAWVVADVRRRDDLSPRAKLLWIVGSFVFTLVVAVAYLAVGRRRRVV
jgi:hypothetical protein